MHNEHPELVRDQYWDKLGYTVKLPYATDTDDGKTHVRFEEPPLHSTAKLYSNVSDITLTVCISTDHFTSTNINLKYVSFLKISNERNRKVIYIIGLRFLHSFRKV